MTGQNDLDRGLRMYLEGHATTKAPDGLLDAALGQVETTSQRPEWLVGDRWFADQTTIRLTWVLRGGVRVAIVVLLIAIAVTAIVLVGSHRRVPPPFGLARPGLIVDTWADHLFAMNVDGSARRQLTFGQNSDFRPTWSPDGTLIAYWSYGSDRTIALKVISPDGQREVTIADRLAPSDMDTISWAPDSRHLTFAAAAVDPPASLSHIYVAEADVPGASPIGGPGLAGFEPAWSPDGKQIAFKRVDPVEGLWLMNPDGSNARPLTRAFGSGDAFDNTQWSPDGRRLLFLAGAGCCNSVWIINADGTGERNISNSPDDDWWPTWSPDGSKVAFVRMNMAGHGAFVVVNPDGSDPVTLIGPSVDSNPPIWSPDETKLVGYELGLGGGLMSSIPPLGAHDGIIVYDLTGKTPPTIVRSADDGSWQRLAN